MTFQGTESRGHDNSQLHDQLLSASIPTASRVIIIALPFLSDIILRVVRSFCLPSDTLRPHTTWAVHSSALIVRHAHSNLRGLHYWLRPSTFAVTIGHIRGDTGQSVPAIAAGADGQLQHLMTTSVKVVHLRWLQD